MSLLFVEDKVETPFGTTYLKFTGTGPLVFVIHGGPGFDHNYLISGLEALAEKRTLVFYDQPGCGQSNTSQLLSPFEISAHFRWLSHHLANGQQVDVLAHSWGTLVFVAAQLDDRISSYPVAQFQNIILINPVPICWEKYKQCRKILMKRIHWLDQLKLNWRTLFEADGAKVMELLLPYYVMDKQSLPTDKFPLDKKIYFQTSQKLKGFDYRPMLEQLPPFNIVIGANDFITTELIDDLTARCSNIEIMSDVGHFPFWEAQDKFQSLLLLTFK